jgi:hypothetical protein
MNSATGNDSRGLYVCTLMKYRIMDILASGKNTYNNPISIVSAPIQA